MKYICLGYLEPRKFENMSESERNTTLDECFSYKTNCGRTDILSMSTLFSPSTRRYSAHFPTSGNEVAVWTNRDTSSGGHTRNHEGK